MNWIKKLFVLPTPLESATRELVEAEHAKLKAETGAEWAHMSVMYNQARIKRLRAYIAEATAQDSAFEEK